MDVLFLHYEEFQLRYNCSMLTDEQWTEKGSPSVWVGGYCIIIGCVYLVLYIPCLIAMRKPDLYIHSCFKIMFFLGILDCLSVMYNCIFGGYFSLVGAVPCPHIVLHYVIGNTSVAVWCAQCITCIILATNRLVDIWNVAWLKVLYEGKNVYFLLATPILYGMAAIGFGRGPLFSSNGYAYFFDPYLFMDDLSVDHNYYTGYLLSFHNISVSISLILLHVLLLFSVWWKSKGTSTSQLSKVQRQLFVQAFCVCTLNFMAATLYVLMQFFALPYFMILVAEFTWQGSTGGAVFIYLVLNRTIRNGVLSLLCRRKTHNSTHPSHTYRQQGISR